MFNSLRYRFLAWFLAFVLLTVGLMIPANLVYHAREKGITRVVQDINSLFIGFLKDTKSVNDFLTIEPANADFFTKGESPYLNYHLQVSEKMNSDLLLLSNSKQTRAFGISSQLGQLNTEIRHFNYLFDSLVYLVYKRGYRNFGLEGELSDYGQLIESAPGLTNRDVYQLKKIENDYFFNNDTSAVVVFKNLLPLLNSNISRNSLLSEYEKANTRSLVSSYSEAFLRLVDLDKKAGIRKNIALRASLNTVSTSVESLFAALTEKTAIRQEALINRLNLLYLISLMLIVGMAILISYMASKHIVLHLEELTRYISVLAGNHLDSSHTINLHNSAREIKQIYREFRNLLSQLKIWEKQRDTALQNAEDTQQRYQELADMLPQSVFETDSFGNYTYANKAWYKAFGYSPADLIDGLNLIETLISESQQEDILGQRKLENSTFTAIRKNNSKFPASVYTDNIVRDGKIAGKRGIMIDITDRVNYIRSLQLETSKAKNADELKSSFLANMSHEIRTPMNSIIGFSNLLASEQIPEIQKKDFTQYIRTSSEILLNLVDDIIDIAKIEAGELKIVKKDSELNTLCEELLTTSLETRKRFNKQSLKLNFNPDPLCPEVFVKTDPFRLRQIMVNLLNNAIKFTDKGSVDFGYTVKDDTMIEFYVKDTGPGLSRDELDMIFERFKRSQRSEEKNIVGTGLGLAISKNLVQLLGGEMWVDSTTGVGTTFLFTIPYLKPTVLPPDRDDQYAHESDYNWRGKTILVVEDDPNSFKFLHELLKKTNAEIIHTTNGIKAVEIVRSSDKIDLVVMDIELPGMSGLEATKLIKKINFQLPVIAQTAYAMSGDEEKMKKAGCDDYIPKPLDIMQVMVTFNHYLLREANIGQQKLPFFEPGKSRIITG